MPKSRRQRARPRPPLLSLSPLLRLNRLKSLSLRPRPRPRKNLQGLQMRPRRQLRLLRPGLHRNPRLLSLRQAKPLLIPTADAPEVTVPHSPARAVRHVPRRPVPSRAESFHLPRPQRRQASPHQRISGRTRRRAPTKKLMSKRSAGLPPSARLPGSRALPSQISTRTRAATENCA